MNYTKVTEDMLNKFWPTEDDEEEDESDDEEADAIVTKSVTLASKKRRWKNDRIVKVGNRRVRFPPELLNAKLPRGELAPKIQKLGWREQILALPPNANYLRKLFEMMIIQEESIDFKVISTLPLVDPSILLSSKQRRKGNEAPKPKKKKTANSQCGCK